jgi:hypothetical protein
MTIEKLQKGKQIQEDLGLLKKQLKTLAESKYPLLSELVHPCTNRFESPDLQQLNESILDNIMSRLNTKVKELEKEFQKL